MTTIKVKLSTGQNYTITESPNSPLILAINKLFQKEKISSKVKFALSEGSKIFLEKTIEQNNLSNNSILVLIVDDSINPKESDIKSEEKKNFEKCFYFLIYICKIPINLFDYRGNSLGGDWLIGRKNGPPELLKEYSPPMGWYGIGLRVINLYDNNNDTWLGNSNKKGEWLIAYHGIKSIESINGILFNGFRKGIYQERSKYKNINYLTNTQYPLCGEGVYFIPNFLETCKYIHKFKYKDNFYKIILMCRINPYKVRICEIDNNLESWIVNGDELNDLNGKKYDDEVRVYRILMKIENC